MALPITFAGLSAPLMVDLDDNFAALGALTAIPCTASGTNTIVLTPEANTPTISAYANYQPFSFIAPATNTGAATARFSGLASLSIYKDTASGPVALVGGEIVTGNAVSLIYDSALNSGAGGFHVRSSFTPNTGAAPATVAGNSVETFPAATLTGSGTCQAVILRTGSAGGGVSDVTDTATAIVGSIPGCGVNTYFRFTMLNEIGQNETLTAGTGVTVSGVATTASGATHDFVGVVTAIGSPAVTIYG